MTKHDHLCEIAVTESYCLCASRQTARNADDVQYIAQLEREQAEDRAAIRAWKKGLERMVSAETDWENGETGVGHTFRAIVWQLLRDPEHASAIARATGQEGAKT